ncbi:MAG: energy-coupling factor ABC transporter ATP-binding protein, partial [Coriobacteriales bacterium]|nr:energy-coupling factor ABC transporter ATP-binding protein [Coriobacteriales bacterium]
MRRALEMREYSFRYAGGKQDVLSHLDMRLDFGELVVLGGDSGSGKSTLLAALIGRIPHLLAGEQGGSIVLYRQVEGGEGDGDGPGCVACGNASGGRGAGVAEAASGTAASESAASGVEAQAQVQAQAHDITEAGVADISHFMGSVLQDADSQIVHVIIGDEVAFGCENFNMAPDLISRRVEDACAMMNLVPTAFTATLSGGQKQRLVTATTLAMGQRILVFDEPLANLDRASAHVLLEHLQTLARSGCAVLIVEHRLDVVAPYADRILWLKDGRVVPYEAAGLPALAPTPAPATPGAPAAGHRGDGLFC